MKFIEITSEGHDAAWINLDLCTHITLDSSGDDYNIYTFFYSKDNFVTCKTNDQTEIDYIDKILECCIANFK
jgi:hypothetical protein